MCLNPLEIWHVFDENSLFIMKREGSVLPSPELQVDHYVVL